MFSLVLQVFHAGQIILFSVFWMIFIVMLYPVIVIKHPTTHKTLNFCSTTALNKDAHHAARGRYRTFSAPCSTGEKEGHKTSSGDKCERDGTSAKNNNVVIIPTEKKIALFHF